MEEKRFREWIELKERIHFSNSLPKIKEDDIWWCSFGENVGIEINGKNKLFSRPVFIYKKLSRFGFIGIPLTSQDKTGSWYVKFDFQNKPQTAVLSQIRTFSVSRLSSRMGRLDKSDARKIRNAARAFFS
ncbi:type II toxin-antitoxin system PemK/MazF family toxin [Candidatus Saccharibacteria bacterium]|nr:type II toxin-antitoxin system PemK/MazF family toxin [Candidatus Saccharibacteria bacterium]